MLRTVRAGLRTFVLAPLFLIYTMYVSVKTNMLARKEPNPDAINDIAIRWTRKFIAIPPISLTVEGMENADLSKQYIIVSNHMSNFDIPIAVQALLPLRARFISKQEVSRIPIFGKAAVHAGVVMIDRKAVRSNHEALNRAVSESMALGHSILLFAEGTRSRDGEMGSFHRGAARLALATGVDILPIVIAGTFDVNPPGSLLIYPGDVSVRVLPAVSVEGMKTQDVPAIMDDLRRQISKGFEELTAGQHQS